LVPWFDGATPVSTLSRSTIRSSELPRGNGLSGISLRAVYDPEGAAFFRTAFFFFETDFFRDVALLARVFIIVSISSMSAFKLSDAFSFLTFCFVRRHTALTVAIYFRLDLLSQQG
jgi:hypothetical protein